MARRERETPEYAAMVRRIIAAHGRRVANADPEDLGEARRPPGHPGPGHPRRRRRAVRQQGWSWRAIADELGTTRQAAQQRFGGNSLRGGLSSLPKLDDEVNRSLYVVDA